MTLAGARQRTPAPTGVGVWADQLRSAAYDAIKAEDITEIVSAQVAKAKEGDTKATAFILGFLTKPAPKVEQVPVYREALSVQASAKPAKSKAAKADAMIRRRKAAAKLLGLGPKTVAEVGEAMGLSEKAVGKILAHEWFGPHANGRQWQITTIGRRDALAGASV